MNKIKLKANKHNLAFYQLVSLLHRESTLVELNAQFVADDKVRKHQRDKTKTQVNCGLNILLTTLVPKTY